MKKLFILLIAISLLSVAFNQVGGLDETFNSNDLGYGYGDGFVYGVRTSGIQNDGKIIFGGLFSHYNSNARNRIVRMNTDGSIDTSFIVGLGFSGSLNSSTSQVSSVQIQNNGKIVIAGNFTLYNGVSRKGIARLNSDGSLDVSFNPGTGATNSLNCAALQSDGKIIIGGNNFNYNGSGFSYLRRLNSDGTLDNTFNIGTGTNGMISTIVIQNDGKIILGGSFSTYNGITRVGIVRINMDGTIDSSFNPQPGTNDFVSACRIQNDGKILIGGNFTNYNGVSINRIARLNLDGTLDISFNPGSGVIGGYISSVNIQNDNKIILGGNFTSVNGFPKNYLTRLNSDGSMDLSFNSLIQSGQTNSIFTTLIQNDDKIIIGGEFIEVNGILKYCISRLNIDGSIDSMFNKGSGVAGFGNGNANYINTISNQSDDKCIIGGRFYTNNGLVKYGVSRINLDGSIDNSFNQGLGVVTGEILCSKIQNDGKIIIGGNFPSYNGVSRNNIARINSDGSLDLSFITSGTFPNGTIYALVVQTDGKIIIAGTFTYNITFNNSVLQVKNIARLNSDGSLDATFNLNGGTGANSAIKNISVQTDGKIIIGGQFTTFNGVTKNYIARLNSNGSIDATFNSGTGANGNVLDTKIQNDGKIVISGIFSTYNGTTRNKIARLNADGAIDGTFTPGTGANNTIFTTSIQSDGKIIIGGSFSTYNGITRNKIARLNSDGTLDTSFDSALGAESYYTYNANDATINASSIQNDGKIIIGGDFTSYNGIGRNRIARIYGGEPCVISTNSLSTNSYCVGSSFNVPYTFSGNVYSGNIFTAQLSDASGSFSSPTVIGTIMSTSNGSILVTIPFSQTFGTNYRIRVVSSQPFFAGTDNGNNITINTVPSSPGSITGNTIVCNGSSNSYIINPINGATSYNWTLPNGWIGASSSNSINVTSGLTGGDIVVNANNSCGSSPAQTLSVIVNTAVPSTPGIINGENGICSGSTNNYSISGVSDATSYTWTLPSGWSGLSNTTLINATSNGLGGNIEVSANNSCGSSATQILTVTVNQNTSSTLTQTANNSFTLNGQTYTQSGTFTQVIPNVNGCDSTITLNLTINNVGLDEFSNSTISIYPNPATYQITIAYAGQIQKLEIMDAKGAKVYSSNENKKEIMLPSSMQTGYYVLLVHTQEGVFRKELMVNK